MHALLALAILLPQQTDLQVTLEQFRADEGNLQRVYTVDLSENRRTRLTDFYNENLAKLKATNFDGLNRDGQVDYILFRNYLERERRQLELQGEDQAKYTALIPFAKPITDLEEARRRMEPIDQEKAADTLNKLAKQIKELKPKLEKELKSTKFSANQAAQAVRDLRNILRTWYGFYNGYDPLFTWWAAEPYKAVDAELNGYMGAIKEKLVGVKPDDDNAIVGNPIGRTALIDALKYEMIPYTPEELLKIADEEYAWCLVEIKKASNQMGFKDDWKQAMEAVKQKHVPPGDQPKLIRELALEAIKFVEDNDLVTVPPLAKESWRMDMMTPERQLVSPFFLGGETILVSYPTHTMSHEAKLMSMRGNNRHFSRATVQHELIPGHHLQGFMNARYKPYRRMFGTPFWTEGWALYWEMLLWDKGFPKTPEDKVGMLFWRMHRCVRIQFSLNFHLGKLAPEQCIEMLVDKVGHERANAEGEVRRSLGGQYSPLYQAAYMLGGLQFRALYKEMVEGSSGEFGVVRVRSDSSGFGESEPIRTNPNYSEPTRTCPNQPEPTRTLSPKEFHDAILQQGPMPVEMVRAILTNQKLTPDFATTWRFRNQPESPSPRWFVRGEGPGVGRSPRLRAPVGSSRRLPCSGEPMGG